MFSVLTLTHGHGLHNHTQFFKPFLQADRRANKIMEFFDSQFQQLEALSSNHPQPTHVVEETKIEITPKKEFADEVKDYDRCIKILEEILVEATDIALDIKNHEWEKLLPLLIQFAKNLAEDIKCFRDADILKMIQDLLMTINSDGDKKQCIMDHLKKAVGFVKATIKDVFAKDMKKALEDFQNAIATLQDIESC